MIWILWLVFIIEEVIRNYYLIKHEKEIDHIGEGLGRIIVATFLLLAAFPINGNLIHVLCWYLGAFFSFWLLFNIGLNALRNKPFGYVGKGALLDRVEALSPSVIMNVFIKAIMAITFIYAFYNTHLFK